MKNLKIFALAAFTLLGFAACQQEELVPQKTTHTVTFVAGAPETTKTTVNISDGTTAKFAWTAEDAGRFIVYENGVAATRVEAGITGEVMSMLAEFSGDVPSSPKYQALFNSEVSATQIVPKNSYAETTDVMVSEVLDGSKRDDEFVFRFKREVAFAKMTLKGLTNGACVSSVKIESDKPIAGKYDLKTGTFIETSNVITLDVLNDIADGNATVWFTTIPVTDATFTITATTVDGELNDVATYTKTFTKTISLTRGDVKPFGVAMEKVSSPKETYNRVTSDSDLDEGEYIIGMAHKDALAAIKYLENTTKTKPGCQDFAGDITISEDGNTITVDPTTVSNAKWSFEAVEGGYSISSVTDKPAGLGTTSGNDGLTTQTTYLGKAWSISVDSKTNACTMKFVETARFLNVYTLENPRTYTSSTTNNNGKIYLYKKYDPRTALDTPTNLAVSEAKEVSWDAVAGAASYVLTIGSDEFRCESNLYDASAIADEYYNVAVVAVPSDTENYKNSDAATLTDAKFGTPALATPTLAMGAVDEFSVNATWTVDTRATNGYNCELYNGETKVGESKTVTDGSVTFDGLDDGVTYTLKVNAIAVEGTKAYAASPDASIKLTTKGTTKISEISAIGTYTVKNAVVYAIPNSYTAIISDGTGMMLLNDDNKHGFSVGAQLLTIAGTVEVTNGIYQFKNPSSTKASEDLVTPNYGEYVEASAEYLASKPNKIVYVHLKGSQSGRNISVGSGSSIQKLYLNATYSSTDNKDIEAYGFIYGYNESFSTTNFIATSITEDPAIPKLSVSPTSKTWESAEVDAATFTVTTNTEGENDWSVTPTTLDWATIDVNKTAGTIIVTPNDANTTETVREATLTVSHSAGTLSEEITLTQKAGGSTGGALKTWTYALSATTDPELNEEKPATVNGATWSITMGTKTGNPTANGAPTNSYKQCGWKWGDNKSNYWSSYTLSTDYFSTKKVKSVTVNFLNNGSKDATMVVKQGETTIGTVSQIFGTTWTNLTANTTQGNGGTLTITYSVAQASYIHSITVEYYE